MQEALDRVATNNIVLIPQEIFRAYDIRGIVDINLTPDIAYTLGLAIGTRAHQQQIEHFVVARDGRNSSPFLSEALIAGLVASGMQVTDIGAQPSGVLYFACHYLNIGSGIMVTGSHNPKNYNGFKILFDFMTLSEKTLQQINLCAQAKDFHYGEGRVIHQDVTHAYIDTIVARVKPARSLKIVIDCGNGIAGHIAPILYKKMGCEVVSLYCEVDGNFPHHHPNPSAVENLQDLIQVVKREQADIGLAFDGDGDRLGVVTAEGEVIWPDRQMILFSQDVLTRHPRATILFDVKCSRHLANAITQSGGHAQMVRTGHSFVKAALKSTGAILAGEMSGHLFFKEDWYGFDDGLYSGARLIELLTRSPQALKNIWQQLPDSVNTPEINIAIPDDEKFIFMEKLLASADFPEAKLITIDGLRVEFKEGWGLIRASNTTPCLVVRFEADDEASLDRIKKCFGGLILAVEPSLVLPF
jgi:phosphomannomutase / phosphoglucomutase